MRDYYRGDTVSSETRLKCVCGLCETVYIEYHFSHSFAAPSRSAPPATAGAEGP